MRYQIHLLFSQHRKKWLHFNSRQFLNSTSILPTVLNTARKMKAVSREDQKEGKQGANESPLKFLQGEETQVLVRSMSDLKTSFVPLGFLCLFSFLSSLGFFIVLSCRDLLVRKPPLGVPLMRQSDTRVVICASIRMQNLHLSRKTFLLPAT